MDFEEFKEKYEKVPVELFLNQVTEYPLVSVCVQTYQHVNYIKDCLEGILMQQTDLSFEILLGEDQSTDGTREICIEYAERFPDKIRLFLHRRENNIKINGNFTGRFNLIYNLLSAKGKYIAICEGDDYWTDPLKLQRQVDFMEANESCTICFHPVRVKFSDSQPDQFQQLKGVTRNMIISSKDYIKYFSMRTVSMLFQKSILRILPDEFDSAPLGDLFLQLFCASKGNVGYIGGNAMSVYRRGVPGAWSETRNHFQWHEKRLNDFLNVFDRFINKNIFKKEIEIRKRNVIIGFLIEAQNYGNKKDAGRLIFKHIGIASYFTHPRYVLVWLRLLLGESGYTKIKQIIKGQRRTIYQNELLNK
jgi:glycosyltransferase involved in cell wall biosynthesis